MDSVEKSKEADILLKLRDSQLSLVQHYEQQRAALTNFVLIAASLAIGFFTQKGGSASSLPVSTLLIILGTYGAVSVTKLYERTQFSSSYVKHYNRRIDELYPGVGVKLVDEDAHAEHKRKFPILGRVHMHHLWCGLHIVIGLVGVFLAIASLMKKSPS